jgi:hypothetical protein
MMRCVRLTRITSQITRTDGDRSVLCLPSPLWSFKIARRS